MKEIKAAEGIRKHLERLSSFYETKIWDYQRQISDAVTPSVDHFQHDNPKQDIQKARKIVLKVAKIMENDGAGVLTEDQQRDFAFCKKQFERLGETWFAVNVILEM